MRKILITIFCLSQCFNLFGQIKPFKAGDKVMFLGNSITHAGFYESYLWLYYMTRFPNEKIAIYNGGSGGDDVGQMNDRFEDDALRVRANIVVLTFGMNDSGYFGTDNPEIAQKSIDKSYNRFQMIQQKFKNHPEITPIMMTSSPYDETQVEEGTVFKNKWNIMDQIATFQKKAAIDNGWGVVDLFKQMSDVNFKQQKIDSTYSILGTGRVHPGTGGHLVMAALFLKNQGLANKPVAKVSIDVKKNKVISSENAKISVLKASTNGLAFDYLANSLPFPIDSVSVDWGNKQTQASVLDVFPFTQDFNQELLQVKGLKDGKYSLKIDNKLIGTFSALDFNKGINLAILGNTPQYQQAKAIMKLNDLRAKHEFKLREYYWVQYNYFREKGLLFDDSQRAYNIAKSEKGGFVGSKMGVYETARFPEVRKIYERDMDVLVSKIYQINKPLNRKVEILPN